VIFAATRSAAISSSVASASSSSSVRAHVLAAERLHGDDTTVPLLARGATRQARLWTYVRDDRPFAGGAPPAALFYFSPDREKTHPKRHLVGWHGTLQADAYGGYNDLYRADRGHAPVLSALCWSHARRKFFELADIAGNVRKGKPAHEISPVALEAVARIDALFDLERGINGMPAEARLAARQQHARPLVEELHDWLTAPRCRSTIPSPRRSTTCSRRRGAGKPSPGSSTTAGFVFRTMPPNAPCAVLLWEEIM
jgi:hypothetical protein